MPANVETMFSVREVPWHGLGKVIEEAPDSEQALILAGLDWAVRKEPIYLSNGRKIEGRAATVRSTDGLVLGIVSSQYQVVQNREAFSFVDGLLGAGVKFDTAGALNSGRRVWMSTIIEEEFNLLGDRTKTYLLFTNSHDGTGAVMACVTPVRVVCQNTLNLALRGAKRSWSVRHRGNVMGRLEEARRTLELTNIYMKRLSEEAEALAKIKVPEDRIEDLLKILVPETRDSKQDTIESKRSTIRNLCLADDLADYKGTGWGVVNAIADYVAHAVPLKQRQGWQERRFTKILDGHPLLDRAYEFVLSLS